MLILFLSLTIVLITVIVQWLQNIMILNYTQIYFMMSKWTKTFAHIVYNNTNKNNNNNIRYFFIYKMLAHSKHGYQSQLVQKSSQKELQSERIAVKSQLIK